MEDFLRELAKNCMDITKYIVTMVLIATFLGDVEDKSLLMLLGYSLAIVFLFVSFIMYKMINSDKKRRNKK